MTVEEAKDMARGGGKRVDDAAAYLGVSRVALYGLMNAGEIRYFKIGNRRIVPVAELDRFMAERLVATAK